MFELKKNSNKDLNKSINLFAIKIINFQIRRSLKRKRGPELVLVSNCHVHYHHYRQHNPDPDADDDDDDDADGWSSSLCHWVNQGSRSVSIGVFSWHDDDDGNDDDDDDDDDDGDDIGTLQ